MEGRRKVGTILISQVLSQLADLQTRRRYEWIKKRQDWQVDGYGEAFGSLMLTSTDVTSVT